MIAKRYLGDGVYVEVEEGMLCLTTSDGISVTNRIYLEPAVYSALEQFDADVSHDEQEREDAARETEAAK